MRRFVIERDMPKIGTLAREHYRTAARRSNEALAQLAPHVQWLHSYVADDKTYCVYLAVDEAVIHRHAELSGFPADRVTEIVRIIDPATAAP